MQYNDEWNKSQGELTPVAGTIDDPEVTYGKWLDQVHSLEIEQRGRSSRTPNYAKLADDYVYGYTPQEAVSDVDAFF